MENHISAVMARIHEIEARMAAFSAPAPPPIQEKSRVAAAGGTLPSATGATDEAKRPFGVALALANGTMRLRALKGVGPFTPQIEALADKYAAKSGLSPQLIRAVIQQESGGNTRSTSAAGAKGLMQLMPETAQTLGVTDPYDPEQNIAAGSRYLAGLLREFHDDLPSALAAYNAGPDKVHKAGGVPNLSETQQYVQKIMGMLNRE